MEAFEAWFLSPVFFLKHNKTKQKQHEQSKTTHITLIFISSENNKKNCFCLEICA